METTRAGRHQDGWDCAVRGIETILRTYDDPLTQGDALHGFLLAVLYTFADEDRHLTDRLYETVLARVRENQCDA
jgi:hypothetical protein